MKSINSPRRQHGSLGGLSVAAVVLIAVGLGALALDYAHFSAVRTELQNAADAAALAGAHDYVQGNEDQAEQHALDVASTNKADGRAVSNTVAGTQVTVQAIPPSALDVGKVRVDAETQISHMLARLWGRNTDQVKVSALAGGYTTTKIIGPNQAFPITVSIDQWPNGDGRPNDKPLNQLQIGNDITIVVDPAGVPGRNAAWTSFNLGSANTEDYRSLIEQNLGMRPIDPDYSIPSLEVGVDEIALDEGLNVGTDIDGYYKEAIKAKPYLLFPVIKGDEYNQHRLVIGFITVKIKNITHSAGNYTFTGTLVKGIIRGWPGEIGNTGNAQDDSAIQALSPGMVKLISAKD